MDELAGGGGSRSRGQEEGRVGMHVGGVVVVDGIYKGLFCISSQEKKDSDRTLTEQGRKDQGNRVSRNGLGAESYIHLWGGVD